jgi:hypothetical protein
MKDWREAIELGPELLLAASLGFKLRGDSCSNTELGRAMILRNFQIP